jgi:hypothetical protein
MLGPQALFRFRPASGPRPFPVCLLTPARGRGPAHVEHVHRRPGPTGSGRFLICSWFISQPSGIGRLI